MSFKFDVIFTHFANVCISLEDKENVIGNKLGAARTSKLDQENQRRPLQNIEPPSLVPTMHKREDHEEQVDELELLCAEQDKEILQKSVEGLHLLGGGNSALGKENAPIVEEDDEFERQMEQLIMERDQAMVPTMLAPPTAPPTQSSAPPLQMLEQPRVEELSVVHKENLSYLKNQENQPREKVKLSGYGFTPGSVEGGPHWPPVAQK